jgi:diaminohydroxyphosphoribosylaminopyrimidine deaminase/5-amino-6-(5-phosphoribosylamino)uracil reductase
MSTSNLEHMQHALQLAARGRLSVSPNPMVGCVIVKNEQVVGTGYHQHAGGPHAEIVALKAAGTAAQNATLYANLEPCCHLGKTPPCTDALIKAGIKKVYAASLDPNPLVAGNGIAALRHAGIEVEIGLAETAAKKLNEIFFYYMQQQRPFVIAKWAMSMDGRTNTHPQDSRDISSSASRQASHQLRQQVDAILIGANTAKQDNPLLTARYEPIYKQPLRIILSSRGGLPLDLKLFDPTLPTKTLVVTTPQADPAWCQALHAKNIEVLCFPENAQKQVDLTTLLTALGKRGITSLLVEGGMQVHQQFFNAHLVNKVHVYLAPMIIGNLTQKKRLANLTLESIHPDFYFTADYEETTHV